MEQKELSVRMKIRKFKNDADKLAEIAASESSTDLEKRVATEYLAKLQEVAEVESEQVAVPEQQTENEEPTLFPKEELEPTSVEEEPISSELTPEEVHRLAIAEKKFDERQAARKTPSKVDRGMREEGKKPRPAVAANLHEGKRENLEESTEVPGLKVGSTVKVGDEEGSVIRVYRSTDGKEKCMVKIGDGKPVKKRVTSVELVK